MGEALSSQTGLKRKQCAKLINNLAATAAKEVKTAGKFTIPGVCRIKTRVEPATKAGERLIFGKMQVVKAKPAKTLVKAYPVAALKKNHLIRASVFPRQAFLDALTVDFPQS